MQKPGHHMKRHAIAVLALLCGFSAPAAADPPTLDAWYKGTAGHRRVLHLGIQLMPLGTSGVAVAGAF
jgi:hypothetical protein